MNKTKANIITKQSSVKSNVIWETEDKDRMLMWIDESKDLVFIDGDKATYLEPEQDLKLRFEMVEWFDRFLPVYALAWVLKRLKGQI